MKNVRLALFALLAIGIGCGPVEVGALTLKLRRGSVDPLTDPGDAVNPSRPVAALRFSWDGALVRWPQDAGTVTVAIGAGETLDATIPAPAAPARLTVEGLLTGTGEVWSLGRSRVVTPPSGAAGEVVTVLLGVRDGFTTVGELTAAEGDVNVVAWGTRGALVLGGGALASDGGVGAQGPGLVQYDAAEGTVTSTAASVARGGIALALRSGAVLHGLGRKPSGALTNELFLTRADGETVPVALNGLTLEARADASAVLSGDLVLIVGGVGAAGPLSSVARLNVDEAAAQATVDALPALPLARSRAAVALLGTGELVVVGGLGANDVALDDGAWIDLGATSPSWRAVGNRMSAARVGAQAVRLEDDSVLLWGGGADGGDVFSLVVSAEGGFVRLAQGGLTGLHRGASALRVGRSVLFVGGEQGAEAPFAARFVPAVQTPSLGQQYAGSWLAVKPGAVPRSRASLTRLDDGSVLLAGGGRTLEVFTPSEAFVLGE